jgi:transposase
LWRDHPPAARGEDRRALVRSGPAARLRRIEALALVTDHDLDLVAGSSSDGDRGGLDPGVLRRIEQEFAGAIEEQAPHLLVDRLDVLVGVVTATALVGFVGDVGRFPSARHFASYLGLTPREHSSGTRRRRGAVNKRGDVYLRTLLTHASSGRSGGVKSSTSSRSRRRRDQKRDRLPTSC